MKTGSATTASPTDCRGHYQRASGLTVSEYYLTELAEENLRQIGSPKLLQKSFLASQRMCVAPFSTGFRGDN
jgi:hypothetical protein